MRILSWLVALALAGCGAPPAADSPPPPPDTTADASSPPTDLGSGELDGGDDAAPTSTMIDPCASASLGDGSYCGKTIGGDAGSLYTCAAGKTSTAIACAMGCQVNPPGVADACIDDGAYHLPWQCGVSYVTTQGNDGDICGSNGGDHTGVQEYAWDFGLPRHTPVLASRGGTVTVAANVVAAGQECYDGCTQPFGSTAFETCCNDCLNVSNHVNVQHADGTVATYWHLDLATVSAGAHVGNGDLLGYSGTSGCSSGPHLHFQVMGDCPTGYCQSIPISFQEAGKPACGDTVTSTDGC